MRNVKDLVSDSSLTSGKETIPVYKGIPTNMQKGSLIFDENTNLFYGMGNDNQVVTLGSRLINVMNTGVNPSGLAITPDSKKAYIANNANYGDYTLTTPPMNINTVTVLDLVTMLPIKTIYDSSFNGAYTVTINSTGTRAYVTNSGGSTITIINTITDLVIGTITGFDGPSGMVITPDGTKAYVNNYGATPGVGSGNGNTVNVVDMTVFPPVISATINLTLAPPAAAPAAIAIDPTGTFVYTANYVDGNPNTAYISKIDTSNNTLQPNIGPFMPGLSGPFSIAITSDGTKAVVTNFGSNNFVPFGTIVCVIDLLTTEIIANIEVGIQPSGLAITKDNKYAYITNYNTLYAYVSNQLPNPQTVPPTTLPNFQFNNLTAGQGTVNIIDLETYKVISPTISVGQSPANIAIAPNGKFALVTNYTSNTVSVISI